MRRLLLHAALLAVVLAAALAFVGTDGMISADEGAMFAELDVRERTGSWTLPNPEPEVDPEMRRLPFELSERAEGGRWAPFAKHPVHIAVLQPLWDLGGATAVIAGSLAAVVVAAIAAGAVADRLRRGSGPLALWLTGIGSPLLFDGFQVVGHALGAACFGLAVVAALAATEAVGPRRIGALAGVAAAIAATALVRSEGVLAGLALGAAFGAAGLWRRERAAVAVGAVAGVAAAAVRLLEPSLMEAALGGASLGTVAASADADASGGVAGRWEGFQITVLDGGYGVDASEPLLVVALLLLVAAALLWRRGGAAHVLRLLLATAAVAAVARAATASFLVPGLLPATPFLAVAAVLLRRADVTPRPRPELLACLVLFAGAVVATQYSTGGTGEWGGRYYAVALPLAVAVAAAVLAEVHGRLPDDLRRVAVVTGCVVVASIAVGALRAAERAKDGSDRAATEAVAAIDGFDVDAVVSTRGAISRFAWDAALDGRRWLTTSLDDAPSAVEALGEDGATRVAVLLADDGEVEESRPEGWVVEEVTEPAGSLVAILSR